jgi:hypothetical protein
MQREYSWHCFSVTYNVYINIDVVAMGNGNIFIDVAQFCAIMIYVDWNWRFFAIEWLDGNRPVQSWFDDLPDDAKEEARDTIRILRNLPPHLWKKPQHDPLSGEEVTEIRFETASHYYRIYGHFGGPPGERQVYTFLYGTDKRVRNDTSGKREATKRKGFITRKEARIHGFKFY